MLHSYYFSASNTTEKVVKTAAGNLGMETAHHNLTSAGVADCMAPAEEDIVLFAAPVYAGRLPAIAVEKFNKIKGAGQQCIAIVVYGNRHYDDSLLELCDLLKNNGFNVVAAAAFVAQHCIFPKVATSRPDAADLKKIAGFSSSVRDALAGGLSLDIDTVYGTRPYKKPAPTPLSPRVDKDKCRECGKCARECPSGAISVGNPRETDAEKCIACSRCIAVCPDKARHFGGLKYSMIAPLFKKMCSKRREPEWFIAGLTGMQYPTF